MEHNLLVIYYDTVWCKTPLCSWEQLTTHKDEFINIQTPSVT